MKYSMNILKKIKSKMPVIKKNMGNHTYYIIGNKKVYMDFIYKRSYSQYGEDMLLSSLYDDKPDYKGFYVDIGAHHPIRFSNTQYFYEKGWRGINIDATPGSMNRFNQLRSEDINIECAISDKNEELIYYCFEESALNSLDPIVSEEKIKKGWKLKEKKYISTQVINSVLEEYLPDNQSIDFINIDIEGLELRILKSFDFEKYAPLYFLIEDIHPAGISFEINNFMEEKNYSLILRTEITAIYKKNN